MHLSFVIVVEDGGTDVLIKILLPENSKLISLTLGLFCTVFRAFVLTQVIRSEAQP